MAVCCSLVHFVASASVTSLLTCVNRDFPTEFSTDAVTSRAPRNSASFFFTDSGNSASISVDVLGVVACSGPGRFRAAGRSSLLRDGKSESGADHGSKGSTSIDRRQQAVDPSPVRAEMATARAGWPPVGGIAREPAGAGSRRRRRSSAAPGRACSGPAIAGCRRRADLGQHLHHVRGLRGRADGERCRRRAAPASASVTSSSVARNALTSVVGRLRMNPTVSLSSTRRREGSVTAARWDRAWRTCARRPARRLR